MDNKLEIELRAKIAAPVVKKLLADNKIVNKLYQRDTYYKFVSIPENSWIVRIREEDGTYFLTYKSKNQESDGAWSEVELTIEKEKALALHAFFLQNGYHIEVEIKKKRVTLFIEGLTVNIDDITGLGMFIEVEAFSVASEMASTHQKIRSFLQTIGVPVEAISEKGYVALMKEVTNAGK